MSYVPTIGLEVHAELATESKMFCGCKNEPHDTLPNSHVCPVCLGHPGTLPVPNKAAIERVLTFGVAVGATQATFSEFDRKNYFYPDIPKAYQISQYKFPFLTGGDVSGVQLTRVHLEEDTARSSHEDTDGSLVDFNRAGVPLMELVTEPVIHSAKVAGDFARELQLILRTLAVSAANMERGEMRIEANISVSQTKALGTKVEVKNINSFRAVESAITFEIDRQTALLEQGETVTQETRGWDENKGVTFSQRSKETAMDYRYFPDPDIPKLVLPDIPAFHPDNLAKNQPILPDKKREILSKYNVSRELIDTIVSNSEIDTVIEYVLQNTSSDKVVSLAIKYAASDLLNITQTQSSITIKPQSYLELMELLAEDVIGSRVAKDILPNLHAITGSIREYVTREGLSQQSDENALESVVTQIIQEHPDQVAEYRAGKETVLKYLVGQGMKVTKGSANPRLLEQLLQKKI